MDPKRLIRIIGYLYAHNAEIVLSVGNTKHESYYDDDWEDFWGCELLVDRECKLEVIDEELDWLIGDTIIEFDSGNNDPNCELETFVYRMTEEAAKRLKKILIKIIEKSKKISQ